MTRVVYYCAASLDGYIAETDDTLGWLLGYRGEYRGEDAAPQKGAYEAFFEGVGALVSGSVTYEFIIRELDAWPYGDAPYWVLSSRDLPLPEDQASDVRMVAGPVTDHLEAMVASAGEQDLWVVGGGNVASQFADEGLLEELRVTVVPVVLGKGKPIFDRRVPGGPMQLVRVVPRDSGMVELTYEIER